MPQGVRVVSLAPGAQSGVVNEMLPHVTGVLGIHQYPSGPESIEAPEIVTTDPGSA